MSVYRNHYGTPLSLKEQRVLYWLSHGLANAKIGERMDITEATVKNYVAALKEKLGANDRAHAVRLGFEAGLLHTDSAVST